ncbi:hypothetical protein V6N13_038904 [Hibiscus sabdariffa]|uniref:Uncharacterized protein n=1 Tax=Hibiscus sabdariffa TaxID=183260 RepID=A0ABR2NEW2_9ROSI
MWECLICTHGNSSMKKEKGFPESFLENNNSNGPLWLLPFRHGYMKLGILELQLALSGGLGSVAELLTTFSVLRAGGIIAKKTFKPKSESIRPMPIPSLPWSK